MDMGGAYSNHSFGNYGGEDVSVASAMSAASAADWEPTKELVEKLLVKAKELDPATVGRSIEKQAITTFFDTGEIPDVQQMVEEITADPLKSILVCMGKNNIGMNKTALVQCQANSRQAANAQASYVEKHMKQELTDRMVRDHALAEYERAKRELESMEAKYSETVAFLSDAQKLERKYRQREALANIFTALIDELKNEAFRPFGTGPIEDIQAAVNLSSFEDCCRLKGLPCLEVLQVRLVKCYVCFC